VGLVAKLAGHSNPTVTLGHYTQAVRGGDAAVEALQKAYSSGPGSDPHCPPAGQKFPWGEANAGCATCAGREL